MNETWIKALWQRVLSSKEEMMNVYVEEMVPKMARITDELMEHLELLDEPVEGLYSWRPLEGGPGAFWKFDRGALDCKQLFVPVWPVDPVRYTWWRTMFGAPYFFTPETYPAATYPLTEVNSCVAVDTPAGNDTWVYMPSRRAAPSVYVLEFFYTVHQPMKETLQLCFNFDSLADRYRFVLNDNSSLGFEVVRNGLFLAARNKDQWGRFRRPCTLPLGQPVKVRLEVLGDTFQLFFDGNLAMAVRLRDMPVHPAHWAIIAWNGADNDSCPMKLEIDRLTVSVPNAR